MQLAGMDRKWEANNQVEHRLHKIHLVLPARRLQSSLSLQTFLFIWFNLGFGRLCDFELSRIPFGAFPLSFIFFLSLGTDIAPLFIPFKLPVYTTHLSERAKEKNLRSMARVSLVSYAPPLGQDSRIAMSSATNFNHAACCIRRETQTGQTREMKSSIVHHLLV